MGERLPREEKSGAITYLAVTSDKGLCGGVNSAVAKECRNGVLEEEAKGNTAKIVCMGMKGVTSLKRLYGDRFTTTLEEVGKSPWNYALASMIGERIIATNPNRLKVVSNTFKRLRAWTRPSGRRPWMCILSSHPSMRCGTTSMTFITAPPSMGPSSKLPPPSSLHG